MPKFPCYPKSEAIEYTKGCICSFYISHFGPFLIHDFHRVCRKSITTDATSGAGTAYPSEDPKFSPDFSGVPVTRSLVFLCNVLHILVCPFVIFLFWPLYCLSFELRLLITPLVPSNFFYIHEYLVCPFVLFLFPIVLSVLLRYTDHDVSNVF